MTLPIWKPEPPRAGASNMARFARQAALENGLALRQGDNQRASDYDKLWRWSVDHPQKFWPALWRFTGVRGDPGEAVLEDGRAMPGARFFPDAKLNFADNLLKGGLGDDAPALVARDERGRRRVLSWHELRLKVAAVAAALRADGVVAGDRVAGFLPNTLEPVIAMLATASIGATWSSCSPDFGLAGVLDRFGQIAPKVLFACDGYTYAGKAVDTRERVAQIRAALPDLKRLVIVPFLEDAPRLGMLAGARLFEDYVERGPLQCAPQPFGHPLFILYSSGTTGQPKCIVHGAGGTLLQHLKELVLHTDVQPGDRLFFYTTCGWMMWNWLVSGLAAGATVVLYDGAPMHPQPASLWDLAEQERLTQFGLSPKYLSALEKSGTRPIVTHRLPELRTILSTGSPLAPEQFDFVYRDVNAGVQLASISGGTDIISCFALGHPQLPVYRGELQCRGLGMAVEVFDDAGKPLRGRPGELVCTRPFPSMPVGFWNDPGGAKYRAAYFEKFPGLWHHGDYAELTPHGGLVIAGRSDATLNPGGVRIGTAEIYRQVERLEEVVESLVIGQDWDNDVRVVLFVRLREGLKLDEALVKRIKDQIRGSTTPRHIPARILQVADIPRTKSGKIVELAVRNVVHGNPVKNIEALANPEALEHFRDIADLKT